MSASAVATLTSPGLYEYRSSVSSTNSSGGASRKRAASRKDLERRIDELQKTELGFIFADEFEEMTLRDIRLPSDLSELHSEPRNARSVTRTEDVAAGLYDMPLLNGAGEEFLFRRMNYLKYRAARRIRSLNPQRSGAAAVEEAERYVREAEETRSLIIMSNVRLVASIAQKFRGSVVSHSEMVGEGHVVLMAAVDKFDYSRGFRFSTYATHAVQRHFYRLFQKTQKRTAAASNMGGDMLAEMHAEPEPETGHEKTAQVAKELLADCESVLSDREREIVDCRFGLSDGQPPETLKAIAERIGLSKERVRQLQMRALEKLHERAVELNLPLAFA